VNILKSIGSWKSGMAMLFAVVAVIGLAAWQDDSPHGEDFRISCDKCHSASGWEIDPEVYSFDHNTTQLPLVGQHITVNCRQCHPTLVFSEAPTECAHCHTDLHEQTVGPDCARCHTPRSWIVSNIAEIHRRGRFPLLGAHYSADCAACHPSASLLRFEPLGVECVDCHMEAYQTAANPNHVEGNFSTECSVCHEMNAYSWSGAGFSHAFFPLTGGHNIQDCSRCHSGGSFDNTPSDCYACHDQDYANTSNPAHQASGFSTDCLLCHTTAPGWRPADFKIHDGQYFPIYSGSHRGEWNSCSDCHENLSDYTGFTCLSCHEHSQSRMDGEHDEVRNYQYNSVACLDCHPRGTGDD
jgi:hypothetical protein